MKNKRSYPLHTIHMGHIQRKFQKFVENVHDKKFWISKFWHLNRVKPPWTAFVFIWKAWMSTWKMRNKWKEDHLSFTNSQILEPFSSFLHFFLALSTCYPILKLFCSIMGWEDQDRNLLCVFAKAAEPPHWPSRGMWIPAHIPCAWLQAPKYPHQQSPQLAATAFRHAHKHTPIYTHISHFPAQWGKDAFFCPKFLVIT